MKAIILVAIFAVAVYSQGWSGAVWNGTSNCVGNCSYCNSWGTNVASVCSQPAAGYVLTSAPTCTACPTGCAQCNGTTCAACASGYVNVSGTCTACSGTGAATCTGTAANTTSCLTTAAYLWAANVCGVTGFSVASQLGVAAGSTFAGGSTSGLCTMADGNNKGICIAYTACTTSGQFLQYVSAAPACAAPSATVTNCSTYVFPAATSYCTQCAQGFYPSAITAGYYVSACTANPTLTLALANATTTTGYIAWCQVYALPAASTAVASITCTACAQGFTPNTAGTLCIPCTTISAACPFTGTWAGYVWNTSTSNWAACPANVATCIAGSSATAAAIPTSCASGYYLQQQMGGVLACVATSTAVSDSKAITFYNVSVDSACMSGYYLPAPTISPCAMGCSMCWGSTTNCSACSTGYTLSGYTCAAGNSSNATKGSVIISGLAFFSAILYYFL